VATGKGERPTLLAASEDVVFASLQRADPGFTREALENLDGDDLSELLGAVMKWTGQRKDQAPAGETPSP